MPTLGRLIEIILDDEMEDGVEMQAQLSQPSTAAKLPTMPMQGLPDSTISVGTSRRRGRRRVIQKKTIKDEEGYLGVYTVTQSSTLLHTVFLTNYSDKGGARLGIFFGGRTACCAGENCYASNIFVKGKKRGD